MASKPFEAVPVYDASFYASLAKMVAEENVLDRDLAIMGQLYSLNIGKGLTFDPDIATKKILDRAVDEAHQWMMEGYATNGTPIWPKTDRTWRFLLEIPLAEGTKVTFLDPEKTCASTCGPMLGSRCSGRSCRRHRNFTSRLMKRVSTSG